MSGRTALSASRLQWMSLMSAFMKAASRVSPLSRKGRGEKRSKQPRIVLFDPLQGQPVEEVSITHPRRQRVQVAELRRHVPRRIHQSLFHEMGQRLDVAQCGLAAK